MLHLILAIISSALVSLVMRISEKYISGKRGMLAINYVICSLMASVYCTWGNLFPTGKGIGTAVLFGMLNGILYLAGFVLLQTNVRKNGVVLSATFMKLGLLVPMVLSIGLFRELPNVVQIIGFFIAIISILLINFEKNASNTGFRIGLILLLLAGGAGDAMSKVYEELGNASYSEQFLFYTFLMACVLCFLLVVLGKERIGRNEILFGILIGIPNYFSARFLLRALESLDAVIVYPTFSVATLMIITLVGVSVFKEKLGKKQWTGVLLIIVSLFLLNLK